MKIMYIPLYYKKRLSKEFMDDIASKLKENNIGLLTTVQFLKQLKQLKKHLTKHKKKTFLGESDFRALEEGQVLGCDVEGPKSIKEKVDAFLYLGSGVFHPIALALETDKPIYIANPTTEEVSLMKEKYRWNYLKILERMKKGFAKAKKVGILISTKPGQKQEEAALKIKKLLEEKRKKAYLFLFDTLVPEQMLNFMDIDAWINTACPRIAIDDAEKFDKPVVNVSDAFQILKYLGAKNDN